METSVDHLPEQVLINNVLLGSIGPSSKSMDRFSGWLLAGYAAFTTVVFGNLSEAAAHLPNSALQSVFVSFFVVAILGIVGKVLAVLVTAACAGAEVGRAEAERAGNQLANLDVPWLFAAAERAVVPPARWLVHRSFAKVSSGNLTGTARLFTLLAQFQGYCAALQAVTVLVVIAIVACGVTF